MYTYVHDLDGLRRSTEAGKRLGFVGRSAIHPSQVPVINSVFTPTEGEVSEAKGLLDRLGGEGDVFVLEDGRIRLGNRFLTERCGYRPEEVEGTCFDSFFDAATLPDVEALCRPSPEIAAPCAASAAIRCKDGRPLPVGLRAEPYRFENRPCVLVVVEPETPECAAAGWDSDLEQYFVSEDGPGTAPPA